MVRGKACNDAVGRYDIENVQALDRGRNEGGVSPVRIISAPGNVRIRGSKRDEFPKSEVIYARTSMASNGRKRAPRLHIDELLDGPVESSAQAMPMRVIVIRFLGCRIAHWELPLLRVLNQVGMLGLLPRFERKTKACDFCSASRIRLQRTSYYK